MQDEHYHKLNEKIDLLKDNHIHHLALDLSSVRGDVTWLKKFFWVVASASCGSLITALFQLMQK